MACLLLLLLSRSGKRYLQISIEQRQQESEEMDPADGSVGRKAVIVPSPEGFSLMRKLLWRETITALQLEEGWGRLGEDNVAR
jgi:hypothetical protein